MPCYFGQLTRDGRLSLRGTRRISAQGGAGQGSGPGSELNSRLLPRAARRIQRVPAAAREPSGADGAAGASGADGASGAAGVPSYRQVVAAYRNWFRTARPPEALTPSEP
ncbi:hypothetical protein ACIRQP_26825 [Streptomyces sp. NPDC102274]|uniref:hypothetical protein n=1 Tax=Streptomyces sp. NPDC102274 TaxID=3366151 RepID=UPI003814F576